MEWKDVAGFEGLYEVSDTGIVRAKDRILKCVEKISCKRKTFGGNVCRAINTNGVYYGYSFRKLVI